MWFETLMGFPETSSEQVRAQITLDGPTLRSQVNGKVWVCGTLETPSLAELRARVQAGGALDGRLAIREGVADVQQLHTNAAHAGALFQVASQFNLLEMTSPRVTPEQGVGIYEHDHTQGPACAITAGAGTIYRHYFAPVHGHTGQSAVHQIDCLADLGAALGNTASRLWTMQNGYAYARSATDVEIDEALLHEIAHALVGKAHGHDHIWQAQAVALGCSGRRCHDVQFTPPRYIVTCAKACWVITAERRQRGAICRMCQSPMHYTTYTEERWQQVQGTIRSKEGSSDSTRGASDPCVR